MNKNDPRSKYILGKNFYQKKYLELYRGELGDFFNMLSHTSQSLLTQKQKKLLKSEEVLPRLKAFFERAQKDWEDSNIVFTNYFEFVAEIYSIFSIGKKLEFTFTDEGKASKFNDAWKVHKMNERIHNFLEESIITGYCGGYFKTKDDTLVFQKIGFQNYVPVSFNIFEKSKKEVVLMWIIGLGETIKNDYAYMINFKQEKNKVIITHKVYNYRGGKIGEERKDILKQLDKDNALNEEGEELNDFKKIPVVMLSSPRKDKYGLGESLVKNIVCHCQDISINETIASVELQEHFKSKMAIPESAVMKNKDGSAKLKHPDYFVVGKNSLKPEYITKNNPFFEYLYTKIEVAKRGISIDTKIPMELLDKAKGGVEKVEGIKMRVQPFIMRIEKIRGEVEAFIKNWAEIIYGNEDVPSFQIEFPEIFKTNAFEQRKDLREELDDNIISRKRYLQESRPELSDEEINLIIEEADKELGSVSLTNNNIDIIGNRL